MASTPQADNATVAAPTPGAIVGLVYDGPLTPATWGWLSALLLASLLIAFYDLGGGQAFDPPDVWVAQTAREMRESPDWKGYILPHFSGELRLQKSPGPYWAVALTSWLRGTPVDEISARIPGAISAVLLVLTIFWLALRIAGQRAAVFAGFATVSSVMFFYWSHRAASDLGVTTLMTISLATLWMGVECEGPRRKQVGLLLLGYFAAGLAMLYKMPMPLPCVGIPALVYVAWFGRWRVFASRWHLVGLLLFLLPWLPWVAAVVQIEERVIAKWWSEFLDRFTGTLPNVADQRGDWKLYLLYVGVVFAYVLPYSLSVVPAIARGARDAPGVSRRGRQFLLIWFFALFAFFTGSAGKEARYLLPAMPPLLVLLGMELSAFFDPQRRASRRLDHGAAWVASALALAGVLAGGFGLKRLTDAAEQVGLYRWSEVLPGYIGVALLLLSTVAATAWLRALRREGASMAALATGASLTFIWTWSTLLPIMQSQAPFRDFATQLRQLAPEYKAALHQVAFQDARVIWYGDVRFPRLIDPLTLLAQEGRTRSRERELEVVGKEMIRRISADELILLVASLEDYLTFHFLAPERLAGDERRRLPQTYIWLTARIGDPRHRLIVFSNQPPPWPEPRLLFSPVAEQQRKIEQALADARARADAILGTPQPTATSQSRPGAASAPGAARDDRPQ